MVSIKVMFSYIIVLSIDCYWLNCRNGDAPLTSAEWAALLDQQQQLHETEMHQWKAVLSNTIQLMDHMVHTLSDLRTSIDHTYHFESTASMHVADEPDSNT